MLIEKAVEMLQKRIGFLEANPAIEKSKILYNMMLKAYFEKIMLARSQGKLLGWGSMTAPMDLLVAMDIIPFKPEQFVIQNLASGEGLEYIDRGAGYGFHRESCSTHVALVGLARSGLLPEPDFTFHNANPCDSGMVLWDVLVHIYQCPAFFLSYPYRHDDEAVDYLKGELEELVSFLEDLAGHIIDPERLEKTVQITHAVNHLCIDINELRKAVPCPISGRHALNLGMISNTSGMPESLNFVESFYQETKGKVEKGEGVVPKEQYRLLWLGGMPYFDYRLIDWMEQEFGAVIVLDGTNILPYKKVSLNLTDPLYCLAEMQVYSQGGWGLYCDFNEYTIGPIIQQCLEYKVNAAISFVNFGCKQFCGPLDRLLRDELKKISIPMLTLDGDINDPRVVPVPQMRDKISQFFLMLQG
jgi:benzoyl-CoA reductase/2-hydroxyglutaryl-CoA dehydratase subunit BcrC/BadD/HgdB